MGFRRGPDVSGLFLYVPYLPVLKVKSSWHHPCSLRVGQLAQVLVSISRGGAKLPDKKLPKFDLMLFAAGCAFLAVAPSFAGRPQSASTDHQNVAEAALPPESARPATVGSTTADSTRPGSVPAASPLFDPQSYRIGVADSLLVSVWQEPELSISVVVRPDGMITLPLVNDVPVVGLKTEELQSVLTEKLKPFVNTPQVTIIVQGIRSRKVYMVGKVGRQGTFDLNDNKTVLELIGEAGGLGAFSKSGSIYILRQVGAKKIKIGFDYKKAIAGRGPNPVLQPGDLVVVP
jgi:polysaccharide export outer membrane protein